MRRHTLEDRSELISCIENGNYAKAARIAAGECSPGPLVRPWPGVKAARWVCPVDTASRLGGFCTLAAPGRRLWRGARRVLSHRQACGRPGEAMCLSCTLPRVGAQPQVVPVRPCEADGLCLASCVICSQL